MTQDERKVARELARQYLDQGDPLGWFEPLYREAAEGRAAIPWADKKVNPNLFRWAEREQLSGSGRSAIKVGCGLGDDAEFLASLGFKVLAFDIAPTAIDWCCRRFPKSRVQYILGDLLAPAPGWLQAFDFVCEAYTLQVLPPGLRGAAIAKIAGLVAPRGRLLVIARGREEGDPCGSMPWPLTKAELAGFSSCGLEEVRFEDYQDEEESSVRRFRCEYRRPDRQGGGP